MWNPYRRSAQRAEARPRSVGLAQAGGRLRCTTGLALVVTLSGPAGELCDRAGHPRGQGRVSRGGHGAVQQMRTADPALGALVQKGYGYALFPDVGKGGLGVGGAYGRGVVYERGQHIGYSDLTQGTVGVQAGGQSFSELLVFETKAALERFTAGQVGFTADASAVVLKSGAATQANFVDGVAVVVQPISGVMVEAAIGGQKFTYQAK